MNTTEEYIFEQHMRNINTKWERFSQEIKQMQTADTFSILYATDIHYIRKYAKYLPAYYKVKEMVDFSKYVGIDLLAITGDIVDGNSTINHQKRDLYDIINLFRESKTTSVLISKGNHDDNSWYAYKQGLGAEAVISQDEWYSYVINPIRVQYPIVVDNDNISGGYYYIDYPMQRIRVINLNTHDVPCITDKEGKLVKEYCGLWYFGIRSKQLEWLSKVLKFDEPGWGVMFMSHTLPVNNGNELMRNASLVWKIILAYKNREKGAVKSTEKYFEAEVSFDYTNNKSNDVLPYLYGHIHEDRYDIVDDITTIGTVNILGRPEMPWDSIETKIDGGWDCILIDRKNRILQSKRYGIESAYRKIYF